ncbi:MAG: 50S ribosomal protein L21 [Planctomycetaceae bacterium]|jgi:large subunit ribosomal protein L21|nr:50S ribosomal protein L21 [Planctomycetaceae bacterium]
MYAIFEKGNHQFKAEVNKRITIDYQGDIQPGTEIEFDSVLLVSDGESIKVGTPKIDNAKIIGKVVSAVKGPKLTIAKFRRRKNSKRKTGHRQIYTLVEINEIVVP